jgi:superfamily II DNA or RNA helicase
MIQIIVENIYCQIIGLSDLDIIKNLDSALSFFVSGHEFTKAFKSGWWNSKTQKWERWDGKKHLLDSKMRFLSGLLDKVKIVLKNNGVAFEIVDQRKDVPFGDTISTKNIESRPYQDRALQASLTEKGGIIKAATGSGKSVMITQLIANTNIKTIVYVIGIDLLYQMKETFERMLGTKVGIIGDGKLDIKRINVCTVWTAATALGKKYVPLDDEDRSGKEKWKNTNKAKIIKVIREAELAIFDECHMLATDTLQAINHASTSAKFKFGYSGTPWRDDGADMLIEATCGKTIIEITASELIHDNYLVQPTIYFVNVPEKEELSDKYQSIYKEYVVENEVRNNKIVKAAVKLVESGRKVLILIKNIKHGQILLEQLEKDFVVYFVKGDVDSDERNRVREEFQQNGIDIIIASVIYDQGVDLPNLDALILAGSGKSSGRALQRLGRVIRPYKGKKDAIVVDFIDHAKYLLNHTEKRIKIYRTEAGFKIKLPERKGDNNDGSSSKEKQKKKSKQLPPRKPDGKMPW